MAAGLVPSQFIEDNQEFDRVVDISVRRFLRGDLLSLYPLVDCPLPFPVRCYRLRDISDTAAPEKPQTGKFNVQTVSSIGFMAKVVFDRVLAVGPAIRPKYLAISPTANPLCGNQCSSKQLGDNRFQGRRPQINYRG